MFAFFKSLGIFINTCNYFRRLLTLLAFRGGKAALHIILEVKGMNMSLVIISIIFAVLFLIGVVEYLKASTFDDIRTDVYKLFLKAEHDFKETHAGKQKMKWVISRARSLLPAWMQMIVTEEMFESMIQQWFDGIKDLLDDGKVNNTGR